ncbi:MAG: ribonuclease PH [Phycisphaerae bacterium]
MRHDGRRPDQLRTVEIVRGFTRNAAGSVLIRSGNTHVLCTASLVDAVPAWREPSGLGWLTAEYDMLPAATSQRRARSRGGADGRTREIERLIGRSLRAAVDLGRLGPRTIHLDCDVLQADGGTRTAGITGAWVALCDALAAGRQRGWWDAEALVCGVAAVSVGVVAGDTLLDLDYHEDVSAEVDCNLVMTDRDEWIEIQATGEQATFDDARVRAFMDVARGGLRQLFELQKRALSI